MSHDWCSLSHCPSKQCFAVSIRKWLIIVKHGLQSCIRYYDTKSFNTYQARDCHYFHGTIQQRTVNMSMPFFGISLYTIYKQLFCIKMVDEVITKQPPSSTGSGHTRIKGSKKGNTIPPTTLESTGIH